MISIEQLTAMYKLQDELNSKINEDWVFANYPWHRAIMVEAVEALEHYGWKWWKKQEPDLAQARIELVDIWHFALSMTMHGGYTQAARQMMSRVNMARENKVFAGKSVTYKLDMLVSAAANGLFNDAAFESLMGDFELTWDKLYTTYVAKNVLNTFRQDNGYKAGTYIKDWNGVEDNVALDQLMQLKPDASPVQLYNKLTEVYVKVVGDAFPA